MKKIVLSGIRKFEIIDVPKPIIINQNDVLLKIDTVGVCGSDIHYYNEGKIGDQVIEFPFTIGHECSAIVEEVGKQVKNLKPGDLVAVEPSLSCHQCEQCLSGREHTCTNQKFLGCPGQTDGCLSEYIIMPERNCFSVPLNINSETAALVEPLSIGFYATKFLEGEKKVDSIAILGIGPIGLSVMLALKANGFNNIYVTDKLDYRLAKAYGENVIWNGNPDKEDIVSSLSRTVPNGFDAVFECCGKQDALDQAIEILKPGGKLLIVGIPEADRISFNINKLRRKEILIQNVRRQNKSIQPVIDLIASRRLSAEFMITHRFPKEKVQDAFEVVSNYKDEVIKALIKF
jgi:L-iditol 2-dehydrogenase